MQQTSETYKRILAGGTHWFENSVVIGDSGRLVDDDGGLILFGGDAILVDTGGPESGFREDKLVSVKANQESFASDGPCVGSAVSAYADVKMLSPYNIPKKARIAIYIRAANSTETSEWIPNGVYFTDTREQTHTLLDFDILTLHAYDAMLLSEITYPSDTQHDYPMLDKDMVQFIADNMKIDADGRGIQVDPRTWDIMTAGYKFPLPVGYSMREVLCMIAAAYAGNFIISPTGELRLVSMFDLPPETRHLITEDGYKITIGGLYISI
ncbi:MAG: hypothetical protein MSS60_00090 [Clostridiales bacterium]|nr:hypothetical protein [Clostridiales bacterium]